MLVMVVPACGADSPVSLARAPGFRASGRITRPPRCCPGIDRDEKQAEQGTSDRFQGIGDADAFPEQDPARIAFALQQHGCERGAHLSRQVRLCMSPDCTRETWKRLRYGPLRKPGSDCKIDLRSRRVIADRTAQPYSARTPRAQP